jgi:hypothetical protein
MPGTLLDLFNPRRHAEAFQGPPTPSSRGGVSGFLERFTNPTRTGEERDAERIRQQASEGELGDMRAAVEAKLVAAETRLRANPDDIRPFAEATGLYQRLVNDPRVPKAQRENVFGDLKGRLGQVFSLSKAGQELARVGGGNIAPGEKGALTISEVFRRRQAGEAQRETAGLRREQVNTERAQQGHLDSLAGKADRSPSTSMTGGPKLVDLDRIQGRIHSAVTALNDPEAVIRAAQGGDEGRAAFQTQLSNAAQMVEEHNRRADQMGAPRLMIQGQNPGQVQILPEPELEEFSAGDDLGADIGTGGFSLEGVGEIPEGSADQPLQQQAAFAQQVAAPPPGDASAQQIDANFGLQQQQPIADPTQRPSVIPALPPQVTQALSQGQPVQASQLVQFYMQQNFSEDQARSIVRDILEGKRPELLAGE